MKKLEQKTLLNEILNAFKLHSQDIEQKMDGLKTDLESKMDMLKTDLESKMDEGFNHVDHQISELGKKVDGIRTELNETNENVDYLLSKNAQHEKKLRKIFEQQQMQSSLPHNP